MKDLLGNEKNLEIFLVGADAQTPLYYWKSLPIIISISRPGEVKISGLDDVTLTPSSPKVTMDACIYSSTGQAGVFLDGMHSQTGEAFQLKASGSSNYLPYFLSLGTNKTSTKDILYEGFEEAKPWEVEKKNEHCNNGSNTFFTVWVDPDEAASAPEDTYSDTLTVIVTPK
ncbi:hypothetical protein [Endozoicomonas atrinae]|uniref:hypothetical protein n=1 Tax=Endozoicomonas atrinae TaxID=1333660 RepID=UPI003B00E63F